MTMNNYCCKSMPCRSIKMLQKHLLWSGKLKNNKTEDTVGNYLIVMSYRIHQPFLFVPDELLKNFVQQEIKNTENFREILPFFRGNPCHTVDLTDIKSSYFDLL